MAAITLKYLLLLKSRLLLKLLLLRRRQRRFQKCKKSIWIRNIYEEREENGEYHHLAKELRLHDAEYFFKCFRMTPVVFEELLNWLGPHLQKHDTQMRKAISPSERLSVCLRYLATGNAQVTIATSYRISPTVVGRIINETCEAVWKVLIAKGFIRYPSTEPEWKSIAEDFARIWNFPNCLGALDGKHVVMQAPAKSGSSFFTYKKTFSIVLLAICDARYKFTLVDIGDTGRQSDGSVYNSSHLGYAIENNLLKIPGPA